MMGFHLMVSRQTGSELAMAVDALLLRALVESYVWLKMYRAQSSNDSTMKNHQLRNDTQLGNATSPQ